MEDRLELLALYVHGGLVGVHQLLQLLHISALQHRHLDPLPEEVEGGHGGDLVLRRDVLAVVHVNLEEEEVRIVEPAAGWR